MTVLCGAVASPSGGFASHIKPQSICSGARLQVLCWRFDGHVGFNSSDLIFDNLVVK